MKSDFTKLGILINYNDLDNLDVLPEDVRVICPTKFVEGKNDNGIKRTVKKIGDLTSTDIYAAYTAKYRELMSDSFAREDAFITIEEAASNLSRNVKSTALNAVRDYRTEHMDRLKKLVSVKEEDKQKDEVAVRSIDNSNSAKETAKKGSRWMKLAPYVLASAIALTAYSCGKHSGDRVYVPASVVEVDQPSRDVVEPIETTPVVEVKDTTIAPQKTVAVEVASEPAVEVEPEVITVEDDSIETVVDNVYSNLIEIQKKDPTFAQGFTKDGITGLVLYTRGDEQSFITNQEAYAYLTDLVQNREFNVADLYKGSKSYDDIKRVETAFDEIIEENYVFDDETNAYVTLDDVVKKMDIDNYPLAIGLSAIRDKANIFGVDTSSMTSARGLGVDNPNSDQILNAQRHNNFDINNPDSRLTQSVYKAVAQDEQISLSR